MAGSLVSTLKLGEEKLYECGIRIKLYAVKGNRATLVITDPDGSSVILDVNEQDTIEGVPQLTTEAPKG